MPFIELSIACTSSEEARIETALNELGALSVSLLDAADAENERAILEPGVGETPLWADIIMLALFNEDIHEGLLIHALDAYDPGIDWSQAIFRKVEDQNWERAWLDQFKPMQFGSRTWIIPWHADAPEQAQNGVIIRLDPGLAFGSGTHPTTALCLQWLDGLNLQDQHVLDFGCGSGILALAALKLGAQHAIGIDNDPQALIATRDNADRNGVGDSLEVYLPDQAPAGQYPIVIANILASALISLVDVLAARVQTGGIIALSGILHHQAQEVIDCYTKYFDELTVIQLDDWVRISGRRNHTA
jgi:ribosomal protein L11 methyltransferase